jgi:hypothetical protein
MPAFREPPQVIGQAQRLQLGDEMRQVLSPKRNVVEDAPAVWDSRTLDNMENCLVAVIQPRARERECRSWTRRETQNVSIKGHRFFCIRCKDGEVIHPSDRHASPSSQQQGVF